VWTPAEVDAACAGDAEAARAAKRVWGITEEGNFETPPEESGATVLSEVEAPADAMALERARRALFEVREKRPKPFRDEKVLASWNALMIGALADAGAALDPGLVAAAERAMCHVERVLVVPEGAGRSRVRRLAKDGAAKGQGFLDDHAYLADAALDLYEATGDGHWVALAHSLGETLLTHFFDAKEGSFFFVPDDGESILVRAKDAHDHAVPSGASVACRALLRLGALVDARLHEPAARAAANLATAAARNPAGMSSGVCVGDRLVRGSVDVVLVGPRQADATQALAREVFRAWLPDRVLAWLDPTDPRSAQACPLLAAGKPVHPQPVAYVCRGRTCSLPIAEPAALAQELRR
jgi:hypothetical protein